MPLTCRLGAGGALMVRRIFQGLFNISSDFAYVRDEKLAPQGSQIRLQPPYPFLVVDARSAAKPHAVTRDYTLGGGITLDP